MSVIKILHIADIMGEPGRRAAAALLPRIVKGRGVAFVLGNGENAAGGFGLTRSIAEGLFAGGVDVITGGNHIWDRKEVFDIIDTEQRLLRPANYPAGVPGRGAGVYRTAGGDIIGVLSLLGRVFIKEVECPFLAADRELERLKSQARVIVVDMHAEATSEKVAMGWYLDGRVSAVIGTHTHVQTADERILPGGTAYISDAGMTGPFDSVIGIEKAQAMRRFLTQLPVRFEPAKGDVCLNGVLVEIDPDTGRAASIERLQQPLE